MASRHAHADVGARKQLSVSFVELVGEGQSDTPPEAATHTPALAETPSAAAMSDLHTIAAESDGSSVSPASPPPLLRSPTLAAQRILEQGAAARQAGRASGAGGHRGSKHWRSQSLMGLGGADDKAGSSSPASTSALHTPLHSHSAEPRPSPLVWTDGASLTPPASHPTPELRSRGPSLPGSPSGAHRQLHLRSLSLHALQLGPSISLSADLAHESDSARAARTEADLAYLLSSGDGSSSGGGGDGLFLNQMVAKAAADVQLMPETVMVKRQSSVAEEASRRIASRKATLIAAEAALAEATNPEAAAAARAIAAESAAAAAALIAVRESSPELDESQAQQDDSDPDTSAAHSDAEADERQRKEEKRARHRVKKTERLHKLAALLQRQGSHDGSDEPANGESAQQQSSSTLQLPAAHDSGSASPNSARGTLGLSGSRISRAGAPTDAAAAAAAAPSDGPLQQGEQGLAHQKSPWQSRTASGVGAAETGVASLAALRRSGSNSGVAVSKLSQRGSGQIKGSAAASSTPGHQRRATGGVFASAHSGAAAARTNSSATAAARARAAARQARKRGGSTPAASSAEDALAEGEEENEQDQTGTLPLSAASSATPAPGHKRRATGGVFASAHGTSFQPHASSSSAASKARAAREAAKNAAAPAVLSRMDEAAPALFDATLADELREEEEEEEEGEEEKADVPVGASEQPLTEQHSEDGDRNSDAERQHSILEDETDAASDADPPAAAAADSDSLFDAELAPSPHEDHSFASAPFASHAAAGAADAAADSAADVSSAQDACGDDPSSTSSRLRAGGYFSEAHRARARVPSPGNMSYFTRTPTNRKKNGAAAAHIRPSAELQQAFPALKRQVQAADAAAAERERRQHEEAVAAEVPGERLGFGSGAKQRPLSAVRRSSALSPSRRLEALSASRSSSSLFDAASDPLTVRSVASPTGRSARRIYGGQAAARRSGAAAAATVEARHSAPASRENQRELRPDGTLSPPWLATAARTPSSPASLVDASLLTSAMGGMPATLRPKQKALQIRMQQLLRGFPTARASADAAAAAALEESHRLAGGSGAEETLRQLDLGSHAPLHLSAAAATADMVFTRRHVRKLAKLGASASVDSLHGRAAGLLSPGRSAVHMRSTLPTSAEAAHAVDVLFAAPTSVGVAVVATSAVQPRNLFEHRPVSASSSRPASAVTGGASTARPTSVASMARRAQGNNASGGAVQMRPMSVYNFAAEQESVSLSAGSSGPGRTLGFSASTPLLRPVNSAAFVHPTQRAKEASMAAAAQRRRQTHAKAHQEALDDAARSSSPLRARTAALCLDGDDVSSSAIAAFQREAELVASQRAELQHAAEIERMVQSSLGALAAAEQEAKEQPSGNTARMQRSTREQQLSGNSNEESPTRRTRHAPVPSVAGHAYASPVPLELMPPCDPLLAPVSPPPAAAATRSLQHRQQQQQQQQRDDFEEKQRQLHEHAVQSLPRASRAGPARTFGGADPLLLASAAPAPLAGASSALAASRPPHERAGAILQSMFDGSHHSAAPVTSPLHQRGSSPPAAVRRRAGSPSCSAGSPDSVEVWRAAQLAHGAGSLPSAQAAAGANAHAHAADGPLLGSLLAGLDPAIRPGVRPARTPYALALLEKEAQLAEVRARQMHQLAPPERVLL